MEFSIRFTAKDSPNFFHSTNFEPNYFKIFFPSTNSSLWHVIKSSSLFFLRKSTTIFPTVPYNGIDTITACLAIRLQLWELHLKLSLLIHLIFSKNGFRNGSITVNLLLGIPDCFPLTVFYYYEQKTTFIKLYPFPLWATERQRRHSSGSFGIN